MKTMHQICLLLILLRVTNAYESCFNYGGAICQDPSYQFFFSTDCAANADVKISATESLDLSTLILMYTCYNTSTEEYVVLEDKNCINVLTDKDGNAEITGLPVSENTYCVFSAYADENYYYSCAYIVENLYNCSWPAKDTNEDVSSISSHVPTPSVLLSLSTTLPSSSAISTLPSSSAIPVINTTNYVVDANNSQASTTVVVLTVVFGPIALVAVTFLILVLLAVCYSKRKESASFTTVIHTTDSTQKNAKKVFLEDELSLAPSVITVYSTGYFYTYRNTADIIESKKDLSDPLQADSVSTCTDTAENLPCNETDNSGYMQQDSVTSMQSLNSCASYQAKWQGQTRDGQKMTMTTAKQTTTLDTNAHVNVCATNSGLSSPNDGYITSTMLNLPNDGYISSNKAVTVAQQPTTLDTNAHLHKCTPTCTTNAGLLPPNDRCTMSTKLNSPNDGYISSDVTVTAAQQPITLDTNACTSMHATNPGLLSPDDGHPTTIMLNSLNSEYVDSDMSVMTASKEDGSGYRKSDVIPSLAASEYQPALLSGMLSMQPSLSELSLDIDLQKQSWESVGEEITINPPSEDGYVSSNLFVSMASSNDGSGYKPNPLILSPSMSELQPSPVADMSCTKASPTGAEFEVDLLMQDLEVDAEERTLNPSSGYLEDRQTSVHPSRCLQDNWTSIPSSGHLQDNRTSLPSSGYLDNHTSLASSGYLEDNLTSLTSGQPHISEGDLENIHLPVDAGFGTGTFGPPSSAHNITGANVSIVQYPNPAQPRQDGDDYIHANLELLPSVRKSARDSDPFYELDVSGEDLYVNEEEDKSDVPMCPTTVDRESGTKSSPLISNDYVQWDVSNKQVPLSVSQPIRQTSLSEASDCSGYVKAADFSNSPHNQNLQPIRPMIDDYIYT